MKGYGTSLHVIKLNPYSCKHEKKPAVILKGCNQFGYRAFSIH